MDLRDVSIKWERRREGTPPRELALPFAREWAGSRPLASRLHLLRVGWQSGFPQVDEQAPEVLPCLLP